MKKRVKFWWGMAIQWVTVIITMEANMQHDSTEQAVIAQMNEARAKKEAQIYRLILDLQQQKTLQASMAKKEAKS